MSVTTALASDLLAPAPGASRQQIIDLLADFSIEATPAAARNGGLGLLPAGTCVYVAFVPGEEWRNVVDAACRIRAANLTPVPHLPARSITSEGELDAFCERLEKFLAFATKDLGAAPATFAEFRARYCA